LKPQKQRDGATAVIGRLPAEGDSDSRHAGVFQSIQNLNIGGRISKSQYQCPAQSGDTETLYRLAPDMRDKIAKVRTARRHDRSLHQESADDGRYDREKAAVYGITVDQVRNHL